MTSWQSPKLRPAPPMTKCSIALLLKGAYSSPKIAILAIWSTPEGAGPLALFCSGSPTLLVKPNPRLYLRQLPCSVRGCKTPSPSWNPVECAYLQDPRPSVTPAPTPSSRPNSVIPDPNSVIPTEVPAPFAGTEWRDLSSLSLDFHSPAGTVKIPTKNPSPNFFVTATALQYVRNDPEACSASAAPSDANLCKSLATGIQP